MNKIRLSIVLCALGFTQFASATQLNEQALQACRMIENDLNRLVCYDSVMGGKAIPVSAKPATIATPQVTAPTTSNESASDTPEFGLEHKKPIVTSDEDSLTSVIINLAKSPRGERIFTLENGQQWRQIGTDSFIAREGDEVEIERGVFNSFLLKKAGSSRSIRVKRVQ
ncbi:FIG00950053: hypothetical protein [Pseudoalteromonas luteoviolacea B = ATCC 29581]|nr:FIG00950053: hypothetical protein [Pseudoalteromonas luteoviolacea B = ATCC 29581]